MNIRMQKKLPMEGTSGRIIIRKDLGYRNMLSRPKNYTKTFPALHSSGGVLMNHNI